MLTRKVYNKLADIIKEIPNTAIRNKVSNEMAGVLKENNPNFNYSKWFSACEVNQDQNSS